MDLQNKVKLEHNGDGVNKGVPGEQFEGYNEDKFFPLKNCIKYTGGMSLVIGIRNDGKTFAVLELMREDYEANGYQSILIYNSSTTINTMRKNSISYNRLEYPHLWAHYEITNEGIVDMRTGVVAIYIMSIHEARNYKGGRLANVKRLVIDEFNRFNDKIKKIYPEMITELLITWCMNQDDVEFILMGNAITVNERLLFKGNITKLMEGITFKPFGKTGNNILIYNYKRPKEQLDKRYAGNGVYEGTKETGDWEHNFGNKMLHDETTYIMEIDSELTHYISTFTYEKEFFDFERLEGDNISGFEGKRIYYIKVSTKEIGYKDVVVAGKKKDITNNSPYSSEFKEMVSMLIEKGLIIYENQFVRDSILALVR